MEATLPKTSSQSDLSSSFYDKLDRLGSMGSRLFSNIGGKSWFLTVFIWTSELNNLFCFVFVFNYCPRHLCRHSCCLATTSSKTLGFFPSVGVLWISNGCMIQVIYLSSHVKDGHAPLCQHMFLWAQGVWVCLCEWEKTSMHCTFAYIHIQTFTVYN